MPDILTQRHEFVLVVFMLPIAPSPIFPYHIPMLTSAIKSLIDWYSATLDTGGYPLIALLMAIESSIFPLPSELVIPPAAHLVATKQANLTYLGIVIAGAIGSWVGATAMYWISRVAGRPFILRYGKYFFITPEKVHGAELWAQRFGTWGILISRFLPVVRHLIGIPAGIVKMDFKFYTLSTLIGSAFWCAILCYLGVKMGQDERLMAGEVKQIGLWVGAILIALGLLYYFLVHRYMKPANRKDQGPTSSH
jgi:membrane protein DedA with SNARE-associated domain